MQFLVSNFEEFIEQKTKQKSSLNFESVLTFHSDEAINLDLLNWTHFAEIHLFSKNITKSLKELDDALSHTTFIVNDVLSIADLSIWIRLKCSPQWNAYIVKSESNSFKNIERHFNHIDSLPLVQNLSTLLKSSIKYTETKNVNTAEPSSEMKFEEGGKFGDLPNAEIGKVCVRFPPEASGFMHVGHAKAALLNAHYRDIWKGRLILRFDDTNPEKEKEDYEQSILEDLPALGFKHDHFSHTSDHFDLMLTECQRLIEMGKAYVDDTEMETMRQEREERIESKCRNLSITENLKRWKAMIDGTDEGRKCCVRAKIDMKSDNGALRDPTIYRCKVEPHVRTGLKYKVYPTYDFACPIVDSIEGVTHALRTSEYNDRNDQYYWICDALNLRKPIVIDYSRLNLQNTVLSKRKLTWFVDNKIVTGWDDARMPTVRGMLRHGMTSEGLRQFILAQGSSRSVAYMEWDKIWAFNKKIIETTSKRYTALSLFGSQQNDKNIPNGLVRVTVTDQKGLERKEIPYHPKDESLGQREIWMTPLVFVEQADADLFVENSNVTFINWGNLFITKIFKENGHVNVEAKLNLTDNDFKKTQKINWLPDPSSCCVDRKMKEELLSLIPVCCITYNNIITKGVLTKDDDFKDYVNRDSKKEECLLGDPLLRHIKKGDILQLMRKGFFICDSPYKSKSPATGAESPLVLISIPDGTLKENPTVALDSTSSKKKSTEPDLSSMTAEQRLKAELKAKEKEDKKAARKAAKAVATGKTSLEQSITSNREFNVTNSASDTFLSPSLIEANTSLKLKKDKNSLKNEKPTKDDKKKVSSSNKQDTSDDSQTKSKKQTK